MSSAKQAASASGAAAASNGTANGQAAANGNGRRKPVKPLPSSRINDDKSLDMLRALACSSTEGGSRDPQPVNNVVLGEVMSMATTTVSTQNPSFADIGLIQKGVGGYLPSKEVIEFQHMYEWSPDTAAESLKPIFAASWFGKTLLPKMRVRPMTRDEAIVDLAQAASAGPDCRGPLESLLFYLIACGLVVERDGKLQAAKTDRSQDAKGSEPAALHTQSDGDEPKSQKPEAKEPPPFGLVGDQGAVQFSINVQVDMKEFAGWQSDRITAFFGGIAAVLAAKGKD
jgi:hypothetical protein